MSNKRKIVLTGANGFLGSHLAEKLLKENFEVHCIVRKSSNLSYLQGLDLQFHTCGLEDISALEKVLENVDYIFHLAGTVAALNYEEYHHGNVTLTKNLLQAALKHKNNIKKIVVTSSLAVGGPSKPGFPIDESLPLQAISLYGKAKIAQEAVCREFMNELPITIARPSVISGEREAELYEFIKTVNNGFVPLVGRKEKFVSIIHVSDLIEAFYKMALSEKTTGQAYYLSSENAISWKELAKVCAQHLHKKVVYLHLPHFVINGAGLAASAFGKLKGKATTFDYEKAKEGVQEAWICKVDKAKADFGFEQKVSIEEGVKLAIDWYKANKWL